MAIFAIGDLHLSLGTDKPMDVFPGWEGYLPKLEAKWRALIQGKRYGDSGGGYLLGHAPARHQGGF